MYNKVTLLEILRKESRLPNFLFNFYVPPFVNSILRFIKEDDKIISCSTFCHLNKKNGFLLVLENRILFVNYPFAIRATEIYAQNIATFSKDTGIWTSINITDAGGNRYKLFNITENCAKAVIEFLNKTKQEEKI